MQEVARILDVENNTSTISSALSTFEEQESQALLAKLKKNNKDVLYGYSELLELKGINKSTSKNQLLSLIHQEILKRNKELRPNPIPDYIPNVSADFSVATQHFTCAEHFKNKAAGATEDIIAQLDLSLIHISEPTRPY